MQEVTVKARLTTPPESVFSDIADPRKPFPTLTPFTTTTVTAVCTVIEPPLPSVMLLTRKTSWASASVPLVLRFNCTANRCRGNGSLSSYEPSRCK
jgi:hypothetical protein